jgi:serine protease Do
MKSILTFPLAAGLILAVAPAAFAQPQPTTTQHQIIRIGDRKPAETETVTFLGVETNPVGPTLTAQLGLQHGVGLVVTVVVPDSPAAGILQPHDILIRLNDQILVDPPQLGVLVRNLKDGEEVTLTLVRGGKEQTVKAKLGRHEVAKGTLGRISDGAGPGFHFSFGDGGASANPFDHFIPREEADRMLRIIRRDQAPGRHIIVERHQNSLPRTSIVNLGRSNLVYTDDEGTLELKIDDGKKDLVATGKDGKTIFSGPVNTDEERKAVPPAVLARLKTIENPDNLGGEIGEGFAEPAMPSVPGKPASAPSAGGAATTGPGTL